MSARLISPWHLRQQGGRGGGANPRDAAAEPSSAAEPGAQTTSLEYEERYLLASAESMLRAGYGHREIERALRRMSPNVSGDSGRRGIFRSLGRLLPRRGRTLAATFGAAGFCESERGGPRGACPESLASLDPR